MNDSSPEARLCKLIGGGKPLLSPELPDSEPVKTVSQTQRAVILDLLKRKKYGAWSQTPDIQVVSDWRAFDLQTVLDEEEFFSLYSPDFSSDEFAVFHAYGDVDFRSPLKTQLGLPCPLTRKKLFAYPAVSIYPCGDDITLRFGHLVEQKGEWVLKRLLEPRISKPAPVTFFKGEK